jgi:hypothetical protein
MGWVKLFLYISAAGGGSCLVRPAPGQSTVNGGEFGVYSLVSLASTVMRINGEVSSLAHLTVQGPTANPRLTNCRPRTRH